MPKTQILGHTISFSEENAKKLKDWKKTGTKIAIRLGLFYLIYLQLLHMPSWGAEATFLLLLFFVGYGIIDQLQNINKTLKEKSD